MRNSGPKTALVPLILALALLGGQTSARAGVLLNGNFSGGLTGWSTDTPSYVSASGGQAVLSESPFDTEVNLYQVFTIQTGATTLSFTLDVLGDEPASSLFFPDAFGASLVDPTSLTSLVPVALASTDSYYTRDLVTGVVNQNAASGVSLTPSPPTHLTVSLDVSSLVGQDVRLNFRLIGGGEILDEAAVGISNVTLNGDVTATPEPSTLVMIGSALIPLVVFGCYRRKSAA